MTGAVLIVIALMVGGMLLMIAEVAIIPGFGAAGVAAGLLIFGGAAYAWHEFGPAWGAGSLLISGAVAGGILLWVPRTKAGRALVLKDALKSGDGESTAASLIGQEGTTITALRPVGVAEIGGRRVDVVTDGVFVEAGRAVRVVAVEGARVVVAPVQ
jgi:membrane-bound serine protease (ClpP class)